MKILAAILWAKNTLLLRVIIAFVLPFFMVEQLALFQDAGKLLQEIFLKVVGWAAMVIAFTALFTGTAVMQSAWRLLRIVGYFLSIALIAISVVYVLHILATWFNLLDLESIKGIASTIKAGSLKTQSVLGNKNIWAIIMAFFVALIEIRFKERSRFFYFCQKLRKDTIDILAGVVSFWSPWVVFSSVAALLAKSNLQTLFHSFGGVVGMVWAGNLLQIILLCTVAKVVTQLPLRDILFIPLKAIALGFSTGSSKVALPEAITAAERLGIPPEKAEFLLPLAAVINMDGTALYMASVALLLGTAVHGELDIMTMITLIPACTILAMGAAGVPMGALGMMGGILPIVGLPNETMSLLIAVDPTVARGRAIINLWGDIMGSITLNHWQKRPTIKKDCQTLLANEN